MAEKKIYIIEVLPQLYAKQWKDQQILEQRTFTDRKILVIDRRNAKKLKDLTMINNAGLNNLLVIFPTNNHNKMSSTPGLKCFDKN